MVLGERDQVSFSVDVEPELLGDLSHETLPVDKARGVGHPGAEKERNGVGVHLALEVGQKGLAVDSRHDSEPKGFRDAVNDSAEYYMLGYYLDRSKTKPGWRKLAVKVKRDHVEVRARSGFFVTNATVDPESSRNSDISSALQSPLDYTSLALVARWDKIEPGKEPGKKHVSYAMHVAADAALIDEADKNHLVLDFVALAKTPQGKQVDQPEGQKIDAHLSPEKLLSIRQNGVGYRGFLDLSPGEYTVRLVVRDGLSGRIGSVAAPLKVE